MKHHPIPYFTFEGTAREALEYYKEVFDGEVTDVQTFGEANFETPPEMDNYIMHARFRKDELFFMVSDGFMNTSITVGNNLSLALELDSAEEIESLYARLKEKGTVYMELQDTFWGATFAKVKDAYGVIWDLNFEKSGSSN